MSRTHLIRGIPYPNVSYFSKENIEGTLDYLPKDGDIIIASYPKTGTTWLSYIVLQIISRGESFPSIKYSQYKVMPSMEMVGPEVIDSLTGVRKYKHHYRYDMVKKNPKSKVLYIYRNPEDTLISYYHFIKEVWEEKIDLYGYFDEFLAGKLEYGGYFEHVLSFLAHKNDDNLLLISYEELLFFPKEGILKIAKFLGEEYYQNLSEHKSLLNKILKKTNFDYMKKSLNVTAPHQSHEKKSSEESMKTINFFRKGLVGDGKKLLSPDQQRRLREAAKEVLKGIEILQDWLE